MKKHFCSQNNTYVVDTYTLLNIKRYYSIEIIHILIRLYKIQNFKHADIKNSSRATSYSKQLLGHTLTPNYKMKKKSSIYENFFV